MENEIDILMLGNILNNLGYRGIVDRDSKRKRVFSKILPKLFEKIQNRTFDEFIDDSNELQGQGLKSIITYI